MIYLIVSIIYFLRNGFKTNSVSSILFMSLMFSTIAAYLTGRLLDLPLTDIFYEFYISIMLFILFTSWKGYSGIKGFDFSDVNENKLYKIEKIVIGINTFVFIVDIILFATVFALLLSGIINVTEYKNGGDTSLRQSIFANLVPAPLITLAFLLAPFGYFSLSLHFYYLIKRNAKKAILHLILSLTIVLFGVISLSRNQLVNYVIVYAIIFLFIKPIFDKRLFKKAVVAIVIFGAAIGYVFSAISEDRFGEKYNIESKSIIDESENPKLVSFLDYFSQWEYFGPKLMEKYNPQDLSWGMYNASGLALAIQQRLYGAEKVNAERAKKYDRIMGDTQSAFHGCVVRCIFDFGYIGTLLFILLNRYFIKQLGPNKRKQIRFKTLLAMPLILPFSSAFFVGNSYSKLEIDLAILFFWVIYLFLQKGDRHMAPKKEVAINANLE